MSDQTIDPVAEAVSQAQAAVDQPDQETAQSDQVADTLHSLQAVIERNSQQLDKINADLREIRQSLKNVFDNDTDLQVAQEQVQQVSTQVKERKAKLQIDPQIVQLKTKISELTESKKDLEETLSNHLLNYYRLTNSTSFDTSDGDQREFRIQARISGGKKN